MRLPSKFPTRRSLVDLPLLDVLKRWDAFLSKCDLNYAAYGDLIDKAIREKKK